jgi:hypothetical protein
MHQRRLNLHPRADYHRSLTDRESDRKISMISGQTDSENRQPRHRDDFALARNHRD